MSSKPAAAHEHPKHSSEKEVGAKVWLIGRSYATQIERKVVSRGGQGSSLGQVVTLMHRHGSEIDGWIAELPDEDESALTDEVIHRCVHVHGRLVRLLGRITYKRQSARSFASKYMHFHRSIVPVYDSVATLALSKLVRWKSAFDTKAISEPEDVTYRQFVLHLRQLGGQARQSGAQPSVRALDWYLMEEAERLRP